MNKVLMLIANFVCSATLFCAMAAQAGGLPSVAVKTAVVKQQAMGEVLLNYGVLEPDPDQVLSLSFPHAGLINRIWVRLGQRVKNGEKLLEIVTSPEARMQYLQATSALKFAQRELDRKHQLLKEQLATHTEVDTAKKNLHDAQVALDALRKRGMEQTQEVLRAPMDGIVTRLDTAQGQRVQADTVALLIASEQRLIARLGVEPEDLGLLQPGIPVTITSVFAPAVNIDTSIRDVHAMINPATHLVDVLVPIPAQKVAKLVLGSRVIGHIHLPTHDALVVPRSAVLGTAPDSYVFKVDAGKALRVPVKIGVEAKGLIDVTGALQAGDAVVISGNYELNDGMAVRSAP